MDTLSNERRAFMRRLRSEPAFLSKHVPVLVAAVGRRLTTRLMGLRADKHRGRKLEPPSLRTQRRPERRALPDMGPALWPAYATVPQPMKGVAVPSSPQSRDGDAEDHYLAHRWGFLTAATIEGQVDAAAMLDECARWIGVDRNKNAPEWEPYSAGERISNLLVFLATLPEEVRAGVLTPALLDFTQESLDWIRQHVEYYGPRHTTNHILCNARAFVLGGVVTSSDAWIDAGMAIFRDWLPVMIRPAGFLRERSSHYQLVVLNWLLDARRFLAADARRADDASFLESYAARMLAAAAMLCDSDGNLLARIGDVSPDATPEQSSARLRTLYPDLWPVPRRGLPNTILADGWFKICRLGDTVLGNFPSGTYPLPFPTHGHCDLTSFSWSHGRDEVLIDPGRYRYTPDETSLFQKSAAAHNVPLVNGMAPVAETLVANGAWWPLPYSLSELTATECAGGVELSHNGFARATPVTRHRRRIVPQADGLDVVDEFDGRGHVEIGFCWHFGPAFERFVPSDLTAIGPRARLHVGVHGLHAQAASAVKGGAAVSRRYGERQPSLHVCLRANAELPAAVTTRFALHGL